MSNNHWLKVTREVPCTKCGKPDRCTRSPDGHAGRCFRQAVTWNEGVGNHNDTGALRPTPRATTPTHADRSWKVEAEKARAAMTDELIAKLSDATGVPASAWARVSPGWFGSSDLQRLHANGAGWSDPTVDGAWAFAEHDGTGRVVGLSLRAIDGRKGSPAGGKRGLVVPDDLHKLPDPVLIVEGASDVAACRALNLAAVGRPSNRAGASDLAEMLDGRTVLVVGERDGKPDGAWPGRDGAKAVAGQLAARLGEPIRWSLPPADAKDVREWLKSKLTGGLNVGDANAVQSAGRELVAALESSAKEVKPERRTQADALVDMAKETYRLGVNLEGEAFAVPREGAQIALMFRGGGSGLRSKLAKVYRQLTGKTPSASALVDALTVLESLASDSEPEPVALRMAPHEDGIVLDLGDATGRVVVVGPDRWTVTATSPVLFRRTALTAALPHPQQAEPAALADVRSLLGVADDVWPLVAGWLVSVLMPEIPHAVPLISGEQGAGKSFFARLLVGLVDPSGAPLRSEPKNLEEWQTAASGSWVVCLDNVSHLPGWLSDAICKAVTGDGSVRRKLYTDSDLTVLAFRRCVMLTSIDPGAMRGDLGDRLMMVDLERIPDDRRRAESELLVKYDAMRPRLLGALLSAASRVLSALPKVHLATMPRMADFARVLAALDEACPELTGGRAQGLFTGQRRRIASEVIEGDLVATAVVELVDTRGTWTGTAAELLELLKPQPSPKGWPASARAMGGHMRRIAPAIQAVGITVVFDREPGTKRERTIQLERRGNQPSRPSQPSPDPLIDAGAAKEVGRSGNERDANSGQSDVRNSPEQSGLPMVKDEIWDSRDDRDGRKPANSGGSYGFPDVADFGGGNEMFELDEYAQRERDALGDPSLL